MVVLNAVVNYVATIVTIAGQGAANIIKAVLGI